MSLEAYHPSVRTFSADVDIQRLLNLYMAIQTFDHETETISEKDLLAQLSLPGHDPSKDRWVVADPGDASVLIGSALIRLPPGSATAEANILVHPEWRRRGIGKLLLSMVMDRAHQLGAISIQAFASSHQVDSLTFLQQNGFFPQGSYTELRLATGTRLPPVIWPFGYTMRPFSQVHDVSLLTQAMNLCYIPLWGHQEVSEEQITSWLPDFNAQGLFLVFSEKGRVVGISRTEPSPERSRKNGQPTGYIDAPGIVPQHRRLDLYRALVLTGINWLHKQGCTVIEMESWGDKLEVLKMYRELGFVDIRQLVCYQLDLSS